MKRRILKQLILSIFCSMFITLTGLAMEYKDIPIGYWAYGEINELTDKNIISGYSKELYLPEKNVTRAEFCAMVIKALEQEDIPIEKMYSFEDVDNSYWAYKYIIRAVNLEILKPADNNYFYPDDFVTRSEVITFLVNLLKTEDISKQDAIYALQNNFSDFEDIPDWLKVPAGKAQIIDVIAKEPPREKFLDYDKFVTRAQAAVFLAKMRKVTHSYLLEKIQEETSPKIAEGIIIDNVLRDGDVVTLPRMTVLPITIKGQLSSKDALPGQMFKAAFANNIVDYEHHLLLSKDIIIIGKVLDSTKAKNLINNGDILFELSGINKNNNLTRIFALASYDAPLIEANKLKKAAKTVIKGRDFSAKDGQIIYIKLFKPLRVNIVTGEVLD